jgi:large subunit ribosomal protein L25
MADATLTAERRAAAGKGAAGRVRREGLVPAVVYGLGQENVSVSVASRELGHILGGASGTNTVITLKVDGTEQLALVRQIHRHPVKGSLVHVDFLRVTADQEIQAEVPVHLIGDAEGVVLGGVLDQLVHSVTVDARPADIPASLEIDISGLGIGASVRVSDLAAPRGVTIRNDAGDLVAQVVAPRVAEEGARPEGEAAEGEGEAAAASGSASED